MGEKKVIETRVNTIEMGTNKFEGTWFFEQGPETGEVMFTLICKNLPLGTQTGFNCDNRGTKPPIHIPPTLVTSSPNFEVGIKVSMPAYFEGEINYYASSQKVFPKGARLDLQASMAEEGD